MYYQVQKEKDNMLNRKHQNIIDIDQTLPPSCEDIEFYRIFKENRLYNNIKQKVEKSRDNYPPSCVDNPYFELKESVPNIV